MDVKVVDRGILEKLRKLSMGNLISLLSKSFNIWTFSLDAQIQINLAGRVLGRRSGHLARSFKWLGIKQKFDSIHVTLQSDVPYARIHETGGTIRPKNVKYLPVPLPDALTPTGQLRKKTKEYDNTFVQKSKKGNLILFQTKGSEIIPLFVLKEKVVIPARHWFSDAVERTESSLYDVFARMVTEDLR